MTGPRPFDGVRVLDVTTTPAGAIASMYIADFGGDVAAVDPGGEGRPAADPIGVYADRNKRIVPLAVTSREGLGQLRRLARRADVIVLDGPLSFLNRFGLDATTLRACNSQLPFETQAEQTWFLSTSRSSTAIFRYRASFAEAVLIDMPSCTGVVQAGSSRSVPASSTMHTRHAPTALSPSR